MLAATVLLPCHSAFPKHYIEVTITLPLEVRAMTFTSTLGSLSSTFIHFITIPPFQVQLYQQSQLLEIVHNSHNYEMPNSHLNTSSEKYEYSSLMYLFARNRFPAFPK